MIKASVYAGEILTNAGEFDSQELAEAWVAYHGFSNVQYEDITASLEQERVNAEALAFLASTDWVVVRAAERGEAVPQDIREARDAARAAIVR